MQRRLLWGELVSSKRGRGRPRTRFKDSLLKENLNWCDIKPAQFESVALEQSS